MSLIKSLEITDKIVEVDFPGIEGFKVKLAYLTREAMGKMRKRCLVLKTNAKTRQKTEEVDDDKFLVEYVKAAVKGWSGLKVKDLPILLPVDISKMNPEEEVVYNEEDAIELVRASPPFDTFLTDAQNDYDIFTSTRKEESIKN